MAGDQLEFDYGQDYNFELVVSANQKTFATKAKDLIAKHLCGQPSMTPRDQRKNAKDKRWQDAEDSAVIAGAGAGAGKVGMNAKVC